MKYSDLGLKTKEEIVTVRLRDQKQEIQVLQYLPIQDKIDLIQIALSKSLENGVYNEMKLDMYFHLYLIYMYTDLEFTEEERADEFTLYNELWSNNIIISVISGMDDTEYASLLDYLKVMKEANRVYRNSAGALLQTFIEDMPKNAAAAAEIVNNFDKDKYQNVIEFAKAANGDRPL